MSSDERLATVKSWFSAATEAPPRELDAMQIAQILSDVRRGWKPRRVFTLRGSPHGTKHGGEE